MVEENNAASGKPIGAIFSPAKRARNYQLGVAWWSYPIHCVVWMFFVTTIAYSAYLAFESGVMGISIAEILMWAFSLYVIFVMLRSVSRDLRLSGGRKLIFYFAYGSACVLKALWIVFFLCIVLVLAVGSRDPSLGALYETADMEVGGYWLDDMDFVTSMIFWGVIYAGFSGGDKKE